VEGVRTLGMGAIPSEFPVPRASGSGCMGVMRDPGRMTIWLVAGLVEAA